MLDIISSKTKIVMLTALHFVHHNYMKNQFFSVKPTNNQLINMEVERTRNHAYEHNAVALNRLQRAYLELREEWGINYPFTAQDLCRKSGYPVSSFSMNFCGGMKGFLSQCERVVIDRFTEAVRGRDYQKGVYAGLQSLLQPIKFSNYNTNRQRGVDIALRTEFCYKVFGLDYWKLVLTPLFPAIDAYLASSEPRWTQITEEAKNHAFDLFAEELHWIVGLLLKEHKNQQNSPDPYIPLDEYVNLFGQFIRTTVLILFSEVNLRDTRFENYLSRNSENNKPLGTA